MHRLPIQLGALGLVLAIAAGPAASSVAAPAARSAASRPAGLILIVIDTLRADHLGCYGHARSTSPQLDALAEQGVRFTRAYSQAPWTTPSVGSLLASRYPSELGIAEVSSRLTDDVQLVSEMLSAAGYATAGVVSHSFCSERWGFAQGFDHFDESNVRGHDAIVGRGVTDRALELLERIGDRPFFLFLHYFDPHVAYIEHPEFRFLEDRTAGYSGPVRSGMKFKSIAGLRRHFGAADYAEIRRIYDSEIAYTDLHIGRLLRRLRERGRFDRSAIVVTSDHGEEFDDHGRLGHAKTLYDELIRVPLILKCPAARSAEPGCAAGRVVDRPVALLDVVPTLLELAGVEEPAGLRGLPLTRNPSGAERAIFSETSRRFVLRGVVQGRHKLILDVNRGSAALFDLVADPGETTDVSSDRPEVAQRLTGLVSDWTASLRTAPAEPAGLVLTPAERERLEALGYLGVDDDEP